MPGLLAANLESIGGAELIFYTFLGYFDSSSLEFSLISTAAYYLLSSSSASDIVGSLLRAYKRDPDTYFVSNEVRRIKTACFLVIYYSFLSVSFSTSSLDYW